MGQAEGTQETGPWANSCPQCHPLSQPSLGPVDSMACFVNASTRQPHMCPCQAHTCSSRVPFPSPLGQVETVSVQ